MRTQRTLKNWGNDSSHLCSPNVTRRKAVIELLELIEKEFIGYEFIPLSQWDNNGLRTHKSKGCSKLYVYAWYWNGSWADPSKELFAVFYKPKQ